MLCISKPDSSLGHIEPVFATMVYKMYFSLKFFQLWFISVSTSAKAVLLQLIRQRAATVPILSRTRSAGVRKFIVTLSAFEHHCVMEATGNYGFLLLYLLHQGGIAVSLVNPKQIKHFARMMMAVTKTDEKDACMIAMYGEKMNPPIYKMPSQAIILLKQKKTVIRQLRKQLVASKNLRGSLVVLPYRDKACVRALDISSNACAISSCASSGAMSSAAYCRSRKNAQMPTTNTAATTIRSTAIRFLFILFLRLTRILSNITKGALRITTHAPVCSKRRISKNPGIFSNVFRLQTTV